MPKSVASFPVEDFKFVRVNATALGDNVVVAGTAGKILCVLGYAFGGTLAVLVQLKTSGGPIKGEADLAALGRAEYAGSIWGPAFETDLGEGITFNLSVATPVRGHLVYVEV